MINQSNERFTKRLDARIDQVKEKIADLDNQLKVLQTLGLDPTVTVKMHLLASQHLDILLNSRKVMQDITTSKRTDLLSGDQLISEGRVPSPSIQGEV